MESPIKALSLPFPDTFQEYEKFNWASCKAGVIRDQHAQKLNSLNNF
jgi:hypothetical protein